MPPTLISENLKEIKKFFKKYKKVIIKPINGHGGNEVFLLKKFNIKLINKYIKKYNHIVGIEGTITTVAPIDKDDENINVCYVGGVDAFGKVKDTRTDQQKNALDKLFKILKTKFPKIKVLEDEDSKPKPKKVKNRKDEK